MGYFKRKDYLGFEDENYLCDFISSLRLKRYAISMSNLESLIVRISRFGMTIKCCARTFSSIEPTVVAMTRPTIVALLAALCLVSEAKHYRYVSRHL